MYPLYETFMSLETFCPNIKGLKNKFSDVSRDTLTFLLLLPFSKLNAFCNFRPNASSSSANTMTGTARDQWATVCNLLTSVLLNNARAGKKTGCSSGKQWNVSELWRTCENLVYFPHHQVCVLFGEAHGGLEFQHIAMRSVSTKKNVLFL